MAIEEIDLEHGESETAFCAAKNRDAPLVTFRALNNQEAPLNPAFRAVKKVWNDPAEAETVADTDRTESGRGAESHLSSPVIERLPNSTYFLDSKINSAFKGEACQSDKMFVQTLLREHHVLGPATNYIYRLLRFLRSCDYNDVDIRSMLVHASVYLDEVMMPLRSDELAHCFVLYVFLAHAYTQDECCPIIYWHKAMFNGYCTMASLNIAVFRLQKERNFILRINKEAFHAKGALFSR